MTAVDTVGAACSEFLLERNSRSVIHLLSSMSNAESESAPESKRIRIEEEVESTASEEMMSTSEILTPTFSSVAVEQAGTVTSVGTEVTSVTEDDVGITQYTFPDLPGFTGIIKDRYVVAPTAL